MADEWLQTLEGAAWNADLATVSRLLEAGADPNATSTGKTALMEAVDEPSAWFTATHRALVVRLVDAGADVNAADPTDGRTVLHYAVRAGEEPVRLLLDYGADPTAAAFDGTTVLHQCVEEGDLDVARALLSAGASANAARKDGVSPIDLARAEVASSLDGDAQALVRLLEGHA